MSKSRTRALARRGFTLVEMVVVMGVVVFLAGLLLTVGNAVLENSRRSETERTLELLDLGVQEWELAADRPLSWWNHGDDPALREASEIHGDTEEILIISEVLDVITRMPAVQQIVARINPRFVFGYSLQHDPAWIDEPAIKQQKDHGFAQSITVLDAWGWPIYATHPGRLWTEADSGGYGGGGYSHPIPRNPDGTIQTYNEERYGIARNRRMCFVSAGPDGEFGSMVAEPGTPEFDQTQDNVFSYPVDLP